MIDLQTCNFAIHVILLWGMVKFLFVWCNYYNVLMILFLTSKFRCLLTIERAVRELRIEHCSKRIGKKKKKKSLSGQLYIDDKGVVSHCFIYFLVCFLFFIFPLFLRFLWII